jgi:hypothetical protein
MDVREEAFRQISRRICATSTHPHQASTLTDSKPSSSLNLALIRCRSLNERGCEIIPEEHRYHIIVVSIPFSVAFFVIRFVTWL